MHFLNIFCFDIITIKMIQNNSANVELSNSQLNTLRSTTKNATEVTLKLKHET